MTFAPPPLSAAKVPRQGNWDSAPQAVKVTAWKPTKNGRFTARGALALQAGRFAVMANSDPNTGDIGDSARPTAVRLAVLALLCAMAFILYVDRVCISQALPQIQKSFGFTDKQASYILMAFTLAYGLFELPTGHWGDRYGSRRVLTRIVVWWSAFTALTAFCTGFWSLLVVRFLFGAGEAGAYPNSARIIARWFPLAERGRVQAVFQAASLLGGAMSPAIVAYLIEWSNWRTPFLVFGAAGVAWAVIFFAWFRDEPSEHRGVNAAEERLLAECASGPRGQHLPIPWGEVIRHPAIWLLILVVSCAAFNSYLYFSWYPKYLQAGRGVSQTESGLLASLVLTGATLGTMLGGWIVDRLARAQQLTVRNRRAIGCGMFTLAAALLVVSKQLDNSRASAAFAALSCGVMFTQQTVWWSCACQVAGRHLGAMFGLMNGLGGIGAMSSQFFFGWFGDYQKARGLVGRDQYDPAMWVYAGVLLLGAFAWLFVDPTRVIGQ